MKFFVSSCAVLLAALAMQNGLLNSDAQTADPAIIACAPQSAGAHAVQGDCTPSSLDSTPASTISHVVLAGGCVKGDLHVMKYTPTGHDAMVAATWCS